MADLRIPFIEALEEPLLFAAHNQGLSLAQRSLLKQSYGAPLDETAVDAFNMSEMDYWSVFQGDCELDELGYVMKVGHRRPYVPNNYREAWLIVGRRGGKTDRFASTIVAYEALCGGHESYVRSGQPAICFQIAQDLRMARYSLHFIRATLESSPIGRKAIKQITADKIELKNGVCIYCVPPTTKSVRGFASPVAVLDEVGMWYQESDSANPDYEIYRALTPGQIQFPNRRIVGISTPWNKAGMLWQNYEAGTNGARLQTESRRAEFEGVFVGHGTTASMGNPMVTAAYLKTERARDVRAFARECLAEFQDSITGFLPTALVERAVATGIVERPRSPRYTYVAAIDPAFKSDAFACAVVHKDEHGVVVFDAVRRFVGRADAPLNPAAVLEALKVVFDTYGITYVYSDQYHLESLGQLARERGIEIIGVPFTAKSKAQLYGNLQGLFHQGRISLVDDYELKKELKTLERTLTDGGNVQISAPAGFHDDMASVACLAASQAMHLGAVDLPQAPTEPTPYERVTAQIEAQRRSASQSAWD